MNKRQRKKRAKVRIKALESVISWHLKDMLSRPSVAHSLFLVSVGVREGSWVDSQRVSHGLVRHVIVESDTCTGLSTVCDAYSWGPDQASTWPEAALAEITCMSCLGRS